MRLGLASCVLLEPPSASIAVFSDLHLYDPLLGTSGTEFRDYIAGDRKLVAELERCGKKVHVVPGNHDVNNPPSLSYAAMPVYGLLVLALDSCRHEENVDRPETGGALKRETMAWIRTAVDKANKYHFTVIALMHHGVLEHFAGQKDTSRELAALGVNLVFTDHFHAQDAVKLPADRPAEKGVPADFLFYVETGSTVTSPCPYRFVRLGSDGTARISTKLIDEVDCDTERLSFQEYAKKLLHSCFVSRYGGDETLTPVSAAKIGDLVALLNSLVLSGRLAPLGMSLYSLLSDPAPAYNEVTIDLISGTIVDGGTGL